MKTIDRQARIEASVLATQYQGMTYFLNTIEDAVARIRRRIDDSAPLYECAEDMVILSQNVLMLSQIMYGSGESDEA